MTRWRRASLGYETPAAFAAELGLVDKLVGPEASCGDRYGRDARGRDLRQDNE